MGDVAALIYYNVVREPMLRKADDNDELLALVADFGVRGIWQPQAEALFDVCVVDTDAQSYAHRPVKDVLAAAEREKKRR